MGFVMGYLWIFWKNHPKLERFHGDIHWRLPNQLDMIFGCVWKWDIPMKWSFCGKHDEPEDFFLGILFCEKLVQSWPYLLVSNCKKGRLAGSWRCWTGPMTCCSDSLVSSCLPFFVQGWVWLRHMAHMNSCRSKVLCQTPAAPRYFQNVVLVSCFSDSYGPFDSARVKNSDGSDCHGQVEMLSKRWTFAMAEVEIGNMLGMHTAQEAYKEIVQNLWKNVPWLTNERRTIRSFVRIRN